MKRERAGLRRRVHEHPALGRILPQLPLQVRCTQSPALRDIDEAIRVPPKEDIATVQNTLNLVLTNRRPLCGPHTRSIVLLITPPEDSEEAENQKMSMYSLGAVRRTCSLVNSRCLEWIPASEPLRLMMTLMSSSISSSSRTPSE